MIESATWAAMFTLASSICGIFSVMSQGSGEHVIDHVALQCDVSHINWAGNLVPY